MLHFFRKIRRDLLGNSQFFKYLKYAIGEILLVVIGILIALQVDTWNERRIDREAEKVILENLQQEFQINLKMLDSTIALTKGSIHSSLMLMELFGEPSTELVGANPDSLIYNSTSFFRFVPTQNTLLDLLQSGRLQLISNKALKDALYDWTQILGNVNEYFEGVRQKTQEDVVPYLTQNYSFKDVDSYSPFLAWKEPSRLAIRKLEVFEDVIFENLVDDLLFRMMYYQKFLEDTRIIILNIINLTSIPA